MSCRHETLDEAAGYCACTSCGYVTESMLLNSRDEEEKEEEEEEEECVDGEDSDIFVTLVDLFDRTQIARIYLQDVITKYKCVRKRLKQYFKQEKKPSRSQRELILVLCVYETLQDNNASRTLKELCYFMGHHLKKAKSVMKTHFPRCKDVLPSDIVFRIGNYVGIPTPHLMKMQNLLLHTQDGMCAEPNTIVGALFYAYHKVFSLETKMEVLCQQVGVDESSIYRLLKKHKYYKELSFWNQYGFSSEQIRSDESVYTTKYKILQKYDRWVKLSPI